MTREAGFAEMFTAATGHPPFPWQQALYDRLVAHRDDNIPETCDLPTGLGKTSVVAVWLIALANHPDKLPRRLVYVVNRRTVVDQTTNEILKLRDNLQSAGLWEPLQRLCAMTSRNGDPPLGISTLRGQFADNEEWSTDPARPAVICGTVDMIGSRLLFEGYRIGFKSRPLHAGFLGQDALLVHDEAHLEPAFQKLVETIQCEQGNCRKKDGKCVRCGRQERPGDFRPLHVMALSATARSSADDGDGTLGLQGPDHEHPVVTQRINASKTLHLHPCEDEKKELAGQVAAQGDCAIMGNLRYLANGFLGGVDGQLRGGDRIAQGGCRWFRRNRRRRTFKLILAT